MGLDLGQLLAAQPATSAAKSHLVAVGNADAHIHVEPGLYALSSDASAGVTICARLGTAAVMPAAGVPQVGIIIPAGATRFMLITQDDCDSATGLAELHHIASAAGPSNLWITRVVSL